MKAASYEHSKSYYAATTNLELDALHLDGRIETDVCVIGGGFTGVATALMLAEHGVDVVLLEANRIGWGASGRNGGQVLAGWSGEGALIKQMGASASSFFSKYRYRGHEIIENWISKYGIACDYVHGAITVALHAKQMRALEKEAEADTDGEYLTLVDKDEVKEHVQSDLYIGGVVDRRGAHCHPLNLCVAEARAAAHLGARLYEGARVEWIEYGARPRVVCEEGDVVAKHVIVAGNAYNSLKHKRFSGFMLPAQTNLIATEPLTDAEAAQVLPTNMAISDANWVLDYFRLSADNRLLFGGECTYSNRVTEDVRGVLHPRMLRVFPQLEGKRIDYAWGGAIGIPLNRIPMIGRLSENVFFAQGYSGHGVNCSHMAAEILTDAIHGNTENLNLFDRARHHHVPAAKLVGGPLLAMGMSWFRLRDLARF